LLDFDPFMALAIAGQRGRRQPIRSPSDVLSRLEVADVLRRERGLDLTPNIVSKPVPRCHAAGKT
jgi:hypothetical protein